MERIIGQRIRKYREALGLDVEAMAERAGCEPDLVRAVEAGETVPALGWLVKMARVLGVRPGTFLDDVVTDDPHITRRGERLSEATPSNGDSTETQAYYSLGRGKADRHMEPFFIVLGTHGESAPSSHEGEEFLVVVSGKVRLVYGANEHLLGPGDSAYYNSVVPHRVECAEGDRAEIYAVMYAPF